MTPATPAQVFWPDLVTSNCRWAGKCNIASSLKERVGIFVTDPMVFIINTCPMVDREIEPGLAD